MVNSVKVGGKLTRDPYFGNSKSGPYVAGNLEAKDGNFTFWVGFYAPGQDAVNVFRNALAGELFEVHGSLVENKKKDGTKILQVKASKAVKLAAPSREPYGDGTGISDDDIPF